MLDLAFFMSIFTIFLLRLCLKLGTRFAKKKKR
jgi:hypothetical protein